MLLAAGRPPALTAADTHPPPSPLGCQAVPGLRISFTYLCKCETVLDTFDATAKVPDTLGSLEGNTKGPGTTSSATPQTADAETKAPQTADAESTAPQTADAQGIFFFSWAPACPAFPQPM